MTEHIVSMENVPAVVSLRPRVLTVNEAQNYIKVGRTKLFELIADGRIEARRNGRDTVLTVDSLDAYLDALPKIAPRGKE